MNYCFLKWMNSFFGWSNIPLLRRNNSIDQHICSVDPKVKRNPLESPMESGGISYEIKCKPIIQSNSGFTSNVSQWLDMAHLLIPVEGGPPNDSWPMSAWPVCAMHIASGIGTSAVWEAAFSRAVRCALKAWACAHHSEMNHHEPFKGVVKKIAQGIELKDTISTRFELL